MPNLTIETVPIWSKLQEEGPEDKGHIQSWHEMLTQWKIVIHKTTRVRHKNIHATRLHQDNDVTG